MRASLGRPDDRWIFTIEQPGDRHHMTGPRPPGLLPGEECQVVWYMSVEGKVSAVFLTSPAIFERIHKRKALTTEDCVVNVQHYEKGVLF